ncbi:hypothetical protein PsYK624_028440 [Phanerochaete sordida]|uniref:Uncharacterized protein n=1 Tax=Phanerochaete sordida TaxID=48140 RepID=A0A9P3G0K7_9APHY|nr:hypothetical protein PsYK624_028440 [Phanerochaete sordida]
MSSLFPKNTPQYKAARELAEEPDYPALTQDGAANAVAYKASQIYDAERLEDCPPVEGPEGAKKVLGVCVGDAMVQEDMNELGFNINRNVVACEAERQVNKAYDQKMSKHKTHNAPTDSL